MTATAADPPKPSPSPLAVPEPWNLVASGYVAENMKAFEAFATEALRLAPARGEVLDVAAGPGSLSLLAARTARHVTAVDFAPAMLAQLTARAAAAGVTNVDPQLGDGQQLPFPDASFDAAYSMFGLIFFPDRGAGLHQLARVLRPGARALVASWPPSERIPIFKAMFAAMKGELPDSKFGEGPTALGSADDFRTEMGAAGLSGIEVHEHVVVTGTSTPEMIWAGFTRGGAPAVLMRRKMGEERFAEFSRGVVARMEDALGKQPMEVRLTALLGIGTRA
jgi:SAM-dependent methyltransferase